MKKLLIVFSLLLGLSAFAQDGPYLVRTHEIRVEGNVAAFIDAQKTYYKAIAKDAVDRDKWAGWACFSQ